MPSNRNMNNVKDRREDLHIAADQENDGLEIDLVALLYRLVEKFKWLIAAALVGTIAAGVITAFFITPMYESTAKLYVVNPKDATIDLSALQTGDKLTADYMQVFNNWELHEAVIKYLDLPYTEPFTEDQIPASLDINTASGTRIIEITVEHSDPERARLIAQTYADAAIEFIPTKMGTETPLLFERAYAPKYPSSPNMTRNLILGFLFGGVLAGAVIVIQFIADDRIRNADMLEKRLSIPTLGMMPVQEEDRKGRRNMAGRSGTKA